MERNTDEDNNACYYDILDISKSATSSEIKKAYRTQALRWHPDKNPDNKEEAERRFKQIAEAYEVLSDKEKKKVYDKYGKEGLNPSSGNGPSYSAGPRHHYHHGFSSFPGFHFSDPFEMFTRVFGNDPFGDDIFAQRPRNGHHSSRHASSQQQPHMMGGFASFPGFGLSSSFGHSGNGAMNLFDDDFMGGGSMFSHGMGGGSSFMSSMSSFGGGGGNMSMSSTSTMNVNGKTVTTKRVVNNGRETVIVTENGQVTSHKVDGVEKAAMIENNAEQRPRLQGRGHSRRQHPRGQRTVKE